MSEKMLPTLQHPFIDGLKNPPKDREKDLKRIRSWMNSQPHLPYISDDFIYLFLHACYYHYEKTKHTIETYFTIRANTPSLFADRNIYAENMQFLLSLADLARLPKPTPEGYRALMYVVKDRDPAEFVFTDVIKGFCMYNDAVLSEEGLNEGFVVIFDMQHVKLGHLARVNLPTLRAFMAYIQEAHPVRLKAIHIINSASFIKHIMRLLQPMIRNELISLLKFHRGNLPEGIPKEIMPIDYGGGEAATCEEMGKELHVLMHKYVKWMMESEYFQADESKRVKKNSWWSMFTGNSDNANPNNLGLADAEFKNMEID